MDITRKFVCEACSDPHDGTYGSGRFCSVRCARSASTKKSRISINDQISKALKGRSSPLRGRKIGPRPGSGPNISKALLERHARLVSASHFDELSIRNKKRKILNEQNGLCAGCSLGETWNGKPLRFQLDHIDGTDDETRQNLRLLCPNCHSQTPTWGSRNISSNGRWRQKTLNRRRLVATRPQVRILPPGPDL